MRKLLCFFGLHDAEIIPVTISYILNDRTGFLTKLHGTTIGKKNTYYWQCKNCKKERELCTNKWKHPN